MIRESKGRMVISVKDDDKIRHTKLVEEEGRISGDGKTFFDSLADLVAYYKKTPLPNSNVMLSEATKHASEFISSVQNIFLLLKHWRGVSKKEKQ